MLNVSVLEEGTNKAVTANVTVKTVNLTGQLKNVVMRQINEQAAIYYIGETPVANQEVLIFDISILPDGVEAASNVRFQRQFYTDQHSLHARGQNRTLVPFSLDRQKNACEWRFSGYRFCNLVISSRRFVRAWSPLRFSTGVNFSWQ